MGDPYLEGLRVYDRLRREYDQYGKLIIAFDFDDTVFDTHNNGWKYYDVIKLLRRWKDHAYFICWSASLPERYEFMYKHFAEYGIPCDAINTNAPWISNRGPKIYANAYLDDRAGLPTIYSALERLICEIEIKEESYNG